MSLELLAGYFEEAAAAVSVIVATGILVLLTWLIGRIAKRGLNSYGDGGGQESAWDRVERSETTWGPIHKSYDRWAAKQGGQRRFGVKYRGRD